ATSLADVAWHIDVGQEVHLDLHETVALTRFAAPAFHVEGKATRPVAPDLRFRQLGEQLAHRREDAGVRRRVGTRRAPDRALVDVDHLVDVLESRDPPVLTWDHARSIEVAGERAMQDVFDQGRLS